MKARVWAARAAAVRAFKELNEKRRQVGTALGRTFHYIMVLYLAQMIVLIYDWFLKPWSAWPLLTTYIMCGVPSRPRRLCPGSCGLRPASRCRRPARTR